MGKLEMEEIIAFIINFVISSHPPIPEKEKWRLLDLLREVRFTPMTFPEGLVRDGLGDLLYYGWAKVEYQHNDVYSQVCRLSDVMIERIRCWISDGMI